MTILNVKNQGQSLLERGTNGLIMRYSLNETQRLIYNIRSNQFPVSSFQPFLVIDSVEITRTLHGRFVVLFFILNYLSVVS